MKNKKLNIILIIADTLRTQNLGFFGYKPSPSPNLDNLAKESIYFTNAYASTTCTDPSITSIMSGNYPLTNGLVNHAKRITKKEEENIQRIQLLPELLKENNYKTYAVDWLSRWHKRGFDYYSGKMTKDFEKEYPIFDRLPFPLYMRILDKIAIKTVHRTVFNRFYYCFIPNPKIPYDPADKVVDRAIEKIGNHSSENPFFLYLHFWDVHAPHIRPKGLKSYLLDDIQRTYLSEIEFLDQQIGRLLDYLKKSKNMDNTLIIFTSDHGENLNDHDIPFNHENLYEDVAKVPLIIKHPSLSSKKIDTLVQHVDIFPTILDLINLKVPEDLDGITMLSILKNNPPKNIRKFAYFEDITYRKYQITKNYRRRGIKVGDLKYIEKIEGSDNELYNIMPSENLKIIDQQLFNLKVDPLEKNNLSSNPVLSQKLKIELDGLIQKLNKKRLSKNQNLNKKVMKSLKIIKTAIKKYGTKDLAIAFKGGKDTTTMMHIIKTFYKEKIPLKVFFNDTTLEFKETYQFIERMKKLWNLDLFVINHDKKELEEFHRTRDSNRKKELSRLMKITAINKAIKKYKLKGFMLGIRRDENPARANEKYFSKRKDHIRIHPLLDWTEEDIWEYIKIFGVPYLSLYDQGYRSVGEKEFTRKSLNGEDERSGRDQEKEQLMSRLRKLGYW